MKFTVTDKNGNSFIIDTYESDYHEEILKDIKYATYYTDYTVKGFHWHMTPLSNRETYDDNGEPWYVGAFFNTLIILNTEDTDKIYLFDNYNILVGVSDEDKRKFNEENYKYIITRAE